MSPRRRDREAPGQLPLTAPAPAPPAVKPRAASTRTTEEAAKNYIARRAKPSVVPGHVKLTFTLDLPRDLSERLSARTIREGKTRKNARTSARLIAAEPAPGR